MAALPGLRGSKGVSPRDRRRIRALAGSFLLHVAMLGFFFGAASGAMVSGGDVADGQTSAVTVSIARLTAGRRQAPDADTQQLALLYQKILTADADVAVDDRKRSTHTSLQSLFDAIDRSAGSGGGAGDARGDAAKSDAQSGRPNSVPATAGEREAKTRGQGSGTTASAGGIWGAVEPCWRSAPNVSRVPVTLEVVLDNRGRIASPPKIVRPSTNVPNEARLISEARALTAISACVPYRSADFLSGQRRFVVNFGETPRT